MESHKSDGPDVKKVMKKSDYIVKWLGNYLSSSQAEGFILGMSGGVDSAVVGALCKAACDNTHALILPCHSQEDDMIRAIDVCKKFDISYEIIDLSDTFDGMAVILGDADRVTSGNLKARLRMVSLYYYANRKNLLVAGTGNRTELMLGYFTKYGDGASDILPLYDIYKTEVWQIAEFLKIPDEVIKARPSAGLWPGQTDEGDIGFSYRDIDYYLSHRIHLDEKIPELERRIKSAGHKKSPAICEIKI